MKKHSTSTKLFLFSMILAVPVISFGLTPSVFSSSAQNFKTEHSQTIQMQNGSFESFKPSSDNFSTSNVSSWEHINSGKGTVRVFDASEKIEEECNLGDISSMDSTTSSGDENNILMINSANDDETLDQNSIKRGVKSSNITLDANSYYYFDVCMKTVESNASIYITGLQNEENESRELKIEQETPSVWETYSFYIATGEQTQTIQIELWLGSMSQSSFGAAFFDGIKGYKLSENLYFEEKPDTPSNTFEEIDLRQTKDTALNPSKYNFDFESGATGWERDFSKSANGSFEVLEINHTLTPIELQNLPSPGLDFTLDNTKALTLWADKDEKVNVTQTENIEIKHNQIYKVTMNVKTNLEEGSFKLIVSEQDAVYEEKYGSDVTDEEKARYTLKSSDMSISSGSGSDFKNGYQTIEFMIKGNQLNNSFVKLAFELENTSSSMTYAVVDNIVLSKVYQEDFASVSNSLDLSMTENDGLIKNSMFNFVNIDEEDYNTPTNWKVSSDSENNISGVVNTFNDYYNLPGFPTNPATLPNAKLNENEFNNVFFFKNTVQGTQSLTTEQSVTCEKNKFYKISFDYLTNGANLDFAINNDSEILLLKENNIQTTGSWATFEAFIKCEDSNFNIFPSITFENESNNFAFIDNFKMEESNADNFNSSTVKTSLTNFLLNLDPENNIADTLTSHPAFTPSNSSVDSGVINGDDNKIFKDYDNNLITDSHESKNNILFNSSSDNSTNTLTSILPLNIESDKYYSLKFKLFTKFAKSETLAQTDEDGNDIVYDYGVNVGLTGFEKTIKISSYNKWEEFEIIFKATESNAESKLFFTLTSQNSDTEGQAFLTDIALSESSQTEYDNIEKKTNFNKTIFASTTSLESDEDQDDTTDDDTTDDNTTTAPTQNDINWLLIPTIITGVAVIIAVVGFIINKLKPSKKQGKRKKEKYDRKLTLDKDVITLEAKKIQSKEIAEIEKGIKNSKTELNKLESDHKEYIEEKRKNSGSKVTQEIERHFRTYSSKRNKIKSRLETMKENLSKTKSADYLLQVEKKVISDAEKLHKLSKKEVKKKPEIKKLDK